MPFPFTAIRSWEAGPLGGASQSVACEPSDRSQPGLLVRPDALQRRVPHHRTATAKISTHAKLLAINATLNT
jgi:hypothetical protein